MTAVVLLGDIPTTGVIREAKAERVELTSDVLSRNAPYFLDLVSRNLREHDAVVVLHPAWGPDSAPRLIRFARGVLRTDRIAAVPLDLPPLALSAVADQIAFMAPHVAPGVLAGVAHRLAEGVFAGAWVNSVARLEHVRTGIGRHVSSYLPRTGFMVSVSGRRIHRITSARPVGPIEPRPADPVIVLVTQEGGDTDWLQDRLRPAVGAVSMTFAGRQPLSSGYWGTGKYAEFVAFSGHQNALQDVIRGTPCLRCPWCEEPTARPVCPFCSMTQPPPAGVEPAGRAPRRLSPEGTKIT